MEKRVLDRLIRNGFEPDQAKEMVGQHFDYSSSVYKSEKNIAECIATIY